MERLPPVALGIVSWQGHGPRGTLRLSGRREPGFHSRSTPLESKLGGKERPIRGQDRVAFGAATLVPYSTINVTY